MSSSPDESTTPAKKMPTKERHKKSETSLAYFAKQVRQSVSGPLAEEPEPNPQEQEA